MAELMFGLGQTKKKKETEAKVRETKAQLKHVTQEEDGLSKMRKAQHARDQEWKEKGREQIKQNTNFDMAQALFGGGGGGGATQNSEEEE